MHGNGTATQAQAGFQNKVFSTTDYTVFKRSPDNREVSDYHLSRLVRAIRLKNLLADFPILVTNDMTIIDGQHRYLAANELGVPIYYRVAESTEYGDLGFVNANVKKWGIRDYHHYWCQKGKKEYLRVNDFMERNPHVRLTTAIPLLSEQANRVDPGLTFTATWRSRWRDEFEGGTWKIGNMERAEHVAAMIADYRRYYSGYRRGKFVNAIMKLMVDPNYDHKRMMHQLKTYGAAVEIRNATKIVEYIDMLNAAYNFNRTRKTRVTLAA